MAAPRIPCRMASTLQPTNRWVLAAFLAFVILGGTNIVAVRFSNRELPPFWGSSIRFFAAAALLFAFAVVQHLDFPRGRALVGGIIFGILGFGAAYAFGYVSLRHVPAGLAAVTLALTPLITFGLAVAQGQEPFQWRPLAGGAVALAGVAVLLRGSVREAVPVLPVLGFVAMASLSAEASIAVKRFPRSHPVTMNVVAMLTGAILLLVLSFIFREPHRLPALASTWTALLYLIILGSSAAFVLFLYVLRSWPASAVAYQFVLFPLVAITLSTLLEKTSVPSTLVGGMTLILAGVFVGAVSQVPFVRTPHRLGPEPCLNCAE